MKRRNEPARRRISAGNTLTPYVYDLTMGVFRCILMLDGLRLLSNRSRRGALFS